MAVATTPPASLRSCAAKPICSPAASPKLARRWFPQPSQPRKVSATPISDQTSTVLPPCRAEPAPVSTSTASLSSTSSACTALPLTTSQKPTSPPRSSQDPKTAGTKLSPTEKSTAIDNPSSQ